MEPHRKPGFANRWRSADRRQAVLGGLLAAALVLAGLHPVAREIVLGVEMTFLGFTALWGLLHPRSVAPVFAVAFRWAFWLALGGTVWFAATVPEEVRRTFGFEPPAWAILAGCPLVFMLGLLTTTLGGMTFAALGAWLTRRTPDGLRSAQAAVSYGWIVVLVRLLVDLSEYRVLVQAAHLTAPLGVPVLCWLAARARMEGEGLAAACSGWLTGLSRRLVIRARGGATVRDLRGLALGALGGVAALVLSVGPGHPLAPLQYQALEGLVRLRNEPFAAATSPTKRPPNVEEDWRRRIVLVRLDPATRARIGKRSEASVIAETVDRLAKYGPLRIVAPLPHLEASWSAQTTRALDSPPAGAWSVEPNRRDLPQLAAVLRRVPAAILAVPRLPHAELMRRLVARHTGGPAVPKPEDRVLRQGLKGLVSAASVSIDAGTEWFGTTRVPAIRLADSPRAGGLLEDEPAHLSPGALVLLAAARGHNNLPLTPWSGGVTVAGARIPAIAPDLALVDYGGPLRAEGLPSVAYSTVLGGGTIYTAEPVDEGNEMTVPKVRRWSPAEYFKGRIVVLEALGEEERETPVGRLGTSALLAHAAATLISGEIVRPVPPVLAVLGVLAAGLLVGASCAGVAPLAAGWRFALILLGPLLAAPVLIVLGTWLDPVTPLFAAVMSFALVTQITYRHELDERQRERDLLARVAAPEVVDELLSRTGQIALGGARRRVCILFADVRGFTPFAESRSAEEVITVINRYTTAMTDALLSHGGILDRYTGDGLISRFEVLGLPEHDVCRAVEAALAIRDASEAVAARLTAEGEGALHVGIGVHYGEAVVGLVGSPAQFHYTAMGHTVVVAARLQGIAAGGEVLITEEVYELTANAFRCEPREPVAVKGISEPIRTYKVLDAQPGT